MYLILTVLIIGILSGAELDIFIPSFPEIQNEFGISPFQTQMTLSLNFIAYCVCSLLAGSMSDRYNRRVIILYSLAIFIIGSFLCSIANHYYYLLIGRVLQGIGIAGPSVIGYVIIADQYSAEKQISLIGWIHGVIAVMMSLAPIIGSYITHYFNWRANFIALLVFGVISFIMTFLFVPSKKGDPTAHISIKAYIPLLKSKKSILFILTLCFLMVPYWVFIGLSPILYRHSLNVSLEDFGFYQGTLAAVFGISSAFSGLLIKRLGLKKSMLCGLYMCILHVLAICYIMIFDIRSPVMITACMAIASASVVMPINIIYPYTLEIIENAKGKASALIFGLRLLISAFGLTIVGKSYDGTFVPIGIWVTSTITIAIIMSLFLMHKHKDLLKI